VNRAEWNLRAGEFQSLICNIVADEPATDAANVSLHEPNCGVREYRDHLASNRYPLIDQMGTAPTSRGLSERHYVA
jgi:hypothetical protein